MNFKNISDLKAVKEYLETDMCKDIHDVLIELIDYAEYKWIQEIALNYIYSDDFIIRCDAYEIIGNSKDDGYINKLLRCIDIDNSTISKLYAIVSICKLIEDNKEYIGLYDDIYKNYLKCRSPRLRVAYLTILYKLTKSEEYINKICQYIQNKDYHIRFVTLNCLLDIVEETNKIKICNILNNWVLKEEANSVKKAIIKAIDELKGKT